MSTTLSHPAKPSVSLTSTSDPVSATPTGEQTKSIARRHDLDALRAIAMLLGIALHGAISFIPSAGEDWGVRDSRASEWFGVFMSFVHGFRMPLFFLISGFFTAMLWRKRGLSSLLWQRTKRILFPLLLGCVTIVPAVWVVAIGAGIYSSITRVKDESPRAQLVQAVREGNAAEIKALASAGANPNQRDPDSGVTPLTVAVRAKQEASLEALVEAGARVNDRNRDGSTPLHSAALLGRSDVADQLVQFGSLTDHRNREGKRPIDLLVVPWGTSMIRAEIAGARADKNEVFTGREELAASGLLGSNADAAAEVVRVERVESTADQSMLFTLAWVFPAFHHLWFLWFLCWLVAAFAVYGWVRDQSSWKVPNWMIVSPLRYAWLLPVTFLFQSMMGQLAPAFGPDTSTGILPAPHILGYYAIFFFFGALYFDCDDQSGRLGRYWFLTIPIAVLIFPIGLDMTMGYWGFTDRWIDSPLYYPVAVSLQVLFVWLMSFGLMGLFRQFFSSENRTMRYVSDSSYWLYLAHLPLIIVAQAIVATWPVPGLLKFTLICTVTTVMLLASYQWCVRYTPIGTLLNGPRKRPEKVYVAELVE